MRIRLNSLNVKPFTALLIVLITVAFAVASWWLVRVLGVRSVWSAFFMVWVPMTWLGSISHVIEVRLPAGLHALRPIELNLKVYERLGIRGVKKVLRRPPFTLFNPGLHLPTELNPASHAALDGRMRGAEASHAILLVGTLAVVVYLALRGWWDTAAWTLLFDLAVNGCPVMLQRYNRALLQRRLNKALGLWRA